MNGWSGPEDFLLLSSPFADGALVDSAEHVPSTWGVTTGWPGQDRGDSYAWTPMGAWTNVATYKWDAATNTMVEHTSRNCGDYNTGCRGSYSGNGALRVQSRVSEIGCY